LDTRGGVFSHESQGSKYFARFAPSFQLFSTQSCLFKEAKRDIPLESRLAVVGLERFRNVDGPVRILALLEEGHEKTGKGGARTVQSMAEVVSSLGVFVSKFHAASLVIAKARAAGDLKIFALTRCPDLDVICLTGAKANVAGTEFNDLIVKA
jgi:hypothetical protein